MDKKVFPTSLGGKQGSNSLPRGPSSSALIAQNSGLDKFKKIAESIDPMEYDDKNKNFFEVLRLNMKDFLHHHFIGGVYQMILLVLSVVSVFQYIYGTYLDARLSRRIDVIQSIAANTELVFAGIFGFDWCLNLFLADHRWSYLTRLVLKMFLCSYSSGADDVLLTIVSSR